MRRHRDTKGDSIFHIATATFIASVLTREEKEGPRDPRSFRQVASPCLKERSDRGESGD
nr:uncharacterized protein LOC117603092 isoform X3 [Osmia lignaria]XP_034177757.1 uncharacterized protein LOC117603092 isoform X3 [Osmia lignaria]